MNRQALDDLKEEESSKGEQDKEHAILHRTVGELVGINRIEKLYANGVDVRGILSRHLTLCRGSERGYLPDSVKPLVGDFASTRQKLAVEERSGPCRGQLEVVGCSHGSEGDLLRAGYREIDGEVQA